MLPHRHLLRHDIFGDHGHPIAAGRMRFVEDVQAHTHDFIEIAVVAHGSGVHRRRGEEHPINPGMVYVVRPGQWHAYSDCRGWVTILNLYLGQELLGSELAWTFDHPSLLQLLLHGGRTPQPIAEPELSRVIGDLIDLSHLTAVRGTPSAAHALGLACCALAGIATAIEPAATGHEPDAAVSPVVRRVIRMLVADLAEPWRMSQVAEQVGISVPHLHRLFVAEVGLPPMAWLARCRVEWASSQLLSTDDPVATIGAAAGWQDPNYFSRQFRTATGMSPSQYRHHYRSPDQTPTA